MHTSKLKIAIVVLLTLMLAAACSDDDDNNGTNNGATNNDVSTNNGNDAGDSPDGDDDDDTGANPDATNGGDLPSSFLDRADDARTASENYFTTFCDCYTDTLYNGDRAACESTIEMGDGADPSEANQCEIDVFNQYQDDFLDLYDCIDREMTEANQCLSTCPDPDDLGTCTEGIQDCTLPQAVNDALEAC
jgi:hypothetical protein